MTTGAGAARHQPGDFEGEAARPLATHPGARLGLAAAVFVYVVAFTRWTVRNHQGFGTFGFDLGIFDQGMWLLSRFKEPFVTILGLHLFGDHTSFILLPLVPLYWLFPSPTTLLVAQTVALGSAAIPLFLLARHLLRDEWPALAVAVAYLVSPAVGWMNVEQFHPDVFEVPLVLWALLCMERRRWGWFLACAVALLSVKEDAPLLTLGLGVLVLLRYDRRIGWITTGASLAWFGIAVWWVLPHFNTVGSLDEFRIPFGGPGGALRTLFTRPWKYVELATSDGRPSYVLQLLASVGFLAVLAPSVALVAALPLASNVLSTFWYQYHIEYHYTAMIVPVLAAAAVFGIARFRGVGARRGLACLMLGSALFAGWLWGPTTLARSPNPFADPDTVRAAVFREAVARIPKDAAISAQYAAITHLDHRVHAYQWPTPFRAVYWGDWSREGDRLEAESKLIDYVLVADVTDARDQAILAELRAGDFETIYDVEGVSVLRRRRP